MKNIPHVIMGLFWQGEPTEAVLTSFAGEIRFNGRGEFSGQIRDRWGQAIVKGEINGNWLKFTKSYSQKADLACQQLIYFLLEGQAYDVTKKLVCGGWKGVYQIDQGLDQGQVTCAIYPR